LWIKFCRIKWEFTLSNCNLRLGTESKKSTLLNKSRQNINFCINRTYSASLTLPINSFGFGHSVVKVTAVWIFLHFVSAQVHDFIQNWTSFNEWKFWQFSFIEWHSFLNNIVYLSENKIQTSLDNFHTLNETHFWTMSFAWAKKNAHKFWQLSFIEWKSFLNEIIHLSEKQKVKKCTQLSCIEWNSFLNNIV